MQEVGLIAVRVYPDGSEQKACAEVWAEVFGAKDYPMSGDIYERDGVKWWTPGNGCQSFTVEVRVKMLDAFKARGIDAEDWTAGGEWKQVDDHQKNDRAIEAAQVSKVGVVTVEKGKDSKVVASMVTVAAKKAL